MFHIFRLRERIYNEININTTIIYLQVLSAKIQFLNIDDYWLLSSYVIYPLMDHCSFDNPIKIQDTLLVISNSVHLKPALYTQRTTSKGNLKKVFILAPKVKNTADQKSLTIIKKKPQPF